MDDYWELIAPDIGPGPEWYAELEEDDMPPRRKPKSYTPRYTICSNHFGKKRRYPDKIGALLAVASARKADAPGREVLEERVYHHVKGPGACHGWHVTSQPWQHKTEESE